MTQITRSGNFKEVPINIVGSSVFGRYPKISTEKTVNLFISDNFLVNYAGYMAITDNNGNPISLGENGRAIFASEVYNQLFAVVGNIFYGIELVYNTALTPPYYFNATPLGTLNTYTTKVYIAENNSGQICISDNSSIYIYNASATPTFQAISTRFIPGMITFHDSYFIAAASDDQGPSDNPFDPPYNNTWRLSSLGTNGTGDGTSWPDTTGYVGFIQTKPDNTQGVIRVPSRGNMVFVFGENVVEPWFNQGLQLFPYARNANYNLDYGCINPATIAATDEYVVWLGINEKSGPIILYSNGSTPEKITTDGIDYVLANLTKPEDSEAFMFRQDGHLIYHINFYTDNLSLFYDFNTHKFFHACDENYNYFIASDVAYFNNQYYFVSRNNGFIYAFDTTYTTYNGNIIPRTRTCKNERQATQENFIANDIGFTLEQGTTNYYQQDGGPIYIETQDGNLIKTEGDAVFIITQNGNQLVTENDQYDLVYNFTNDAFDVLIYQNDLVLNTVPRVDFAMSQDGGESFGNYQSYQLNPIGKTRNQIRFWNLGLTNDFVAEFRFWSVGRVVATDGILNVRT